MTQRPNIVKPEHLDFLDQLRQQGTVNMFGAASPLAEAFELTAEDARIIAVYWMESYGARHDEDGFQKWMDRVNRVLDRYGFVSDDLADQPYRDWYDDGIEPAVAAVNVLEAEGLDDDLTDEEIDSADDFYRGGKGYDL